VQSTAFNRPRTLIVVTHCSQSRAYAGGQIPTENLPQLLTDAAQTSQSLRDALGRSGVGAVATNESRPQNDELNTGCASALAPPEGGPFCGLGFATCISSAYKHKHWIAHAAVAILCLVKAHKLGWPELYSCAVYDCILDELPAKNTVYTPCVNRYMVLTSPTHEPKANIVMPLAAADSGGAESQTAQAGEKRGGKQGGPRTFRIFNLVDLALFSVMPAAQVIEMVGDGCN